MNTTYLRFFFLPFLTLSILSLLSCGEETEELDLNYGYDYFPMTAGHWVEYQVDSVLYSSFIDGGKQLKSSQVREVLSETFTDNENRPAVTVERYVRTDENTAWSSVVPQVWYQVLTDNQAERMEGERRFMNLVFPMIEGRKWSGNRYLNTSSSELSPFADWQYTYTEVEQPKTINGLQFAETTTIVQNDYSSNQIDKVCSTETYAKGVGLVYKEQSILKANDSSTPEPWPDRADSGFTVVIKVLDYNRL